MNARPTVAFSGTATPELPCGNSQEIDRSESDELPRANVGDDESEEHGGGNAAGMHGGGIEAAQTRPGREDVVVANDACDQPHDAKPWLIRTWQTEQAKHDVRSEDQPDGIDQQIAARAAADSARRRP